MAIIKKLLILSLFITTLLFTGKPVRAASSFTISPSSGSFTQGCTASVSVLISVAGAQSNAADIIISYNPAFIDVIDIQPGNAYESYAGKFLDPATGTIKLVGYSTNTPFQGTSLFATILFRPKTTATTGGFTISFTGSNPYNTLDSNIANKITSYDLLSTVTNSSYTFTSGMCGTDGEAPTITFISPKNLQNGIPANASITLSVADTSSGVSLSSVSVIINGVRYTSLSPEVSMNGSPSLYTLTIIPATALPTSGLSVITVIATDSAGNSTSSSIAINANYALPSPTPIIKIITLPTNGQSCPATTPDVTPTPTSQLQTPIIKVVTTVKDITQTNTLTFDITDSSGVVSESFLLLLAAKTYSLQATPEKMRIEGNEQHLIVTVTLEKDSINSVKGSTVGGFVRVSNKSGNTRTETLSYPLPVQPSNIPQSNESQRNVLGIISITAGLLLLGFLLYTLYHLLSQTRGAIKVVDAETKRPIPFVRAFVTVNGKLHAIRGDLFGFLWGTLPQGTFPITLQRYGYSQNATTVTITPHSSTKAVVTLHRL